MNSQTSGDRGGKSVRLKPTRAGRLLQLVTIEGKITCTRIAERLQIPEHELRACRDGARALEPEVQLVLATLVLEIAPECSLLAHRLHAQAQSALRMKQGAVESHMTYHGPRWR